MYVLSFFFFSFVPSTKGSVLYVLFCTLPLPLRISWNSLHISTQKSSSFFFQMHRTHLYTSDLILSLLWWDTFQCFEITDVNAENELVQIHISWGCIFRINY